MSLKKYSTTLMIFVFYLDEVSSKRDELTVSRKRINALGNLTESVNHINSTCCVNQKELGTSGGYLNQTVLPLSSNKNSMSSILTNSSITRYFFNKLKKENQ